jgi:hypothetical protein
MAESPSTAALALPLRAVNVSSPDGWNFGWCAVDANNRIIGYCMTEAQAKQLVAPFAHADSATAADYEEVLADHRRLVRELDVLLNGEEGAAPQASLCDIVMQVKKQGLRSAELAPYKTVEAMRSDAALGQQCEGLIALKTHFTGEPPYVGNEGVLRALREALDELTRLRAMFAAATDVQGDDEVLKYVTSGNAIPVTRCTVSADLIRQLVARSAEGRRAQWVADLEDLNRRIGDLRVKHGADPNETLDQWIARLAGGTPSVTMVYCGTCNRDMPSGVYCGRCGRMITAPQSATARLEIPAEVFDGHAVFLEACSAAGPDPTLRSHHVSAVLDALARLMRKNAATDSGISKSSG